MILTGENRKTLRETCPSATLSTSNTTWTTLGSKSGLRSEKVATDRLSHDTAILLAPCLILILILSFHLREYFPYGVFQGGRIKCMRVFTSLSHPVRFASARYIWRHLNTSAA
jgi:hypothetical protein